MWSFNSLARALGACALLASATASAQQEPSSADVDAAKAQFAEGLDLRESGDLAGALRHFRAAYGFVPGPIIGLEVGRTLVQLNQLVEARAALAQAANAPTKPNESDKAKQSRADAAKLQVEVEAQLATLVLHPPPDADRVTIDDKSVDTDAPVWVAPGHRVVVVHGKDGGQGRAEVEVIAGDKKDVPIRLEAAPGSTSLRLGPVAWAGFGVGAAGLLVGIGTGVGAFVTASSVSRDCPNNQCPPSAHGELDASSALGTTSTIAFVVGGVGVVVGVVAMFVSKRAAPTLASWGPRGLQWQGAF